MLLVLVTLFHARRAVQGVGFGIIASVLLLTTSVATAWERGVVWLDGMPLSDA
jgi:hypothetical protein